MKKVKFETSFLLFAACLLHMAMGAQALAGKGKTTAGGYTTVTLDNRVGQVHSWVNDVSEANGMTFVAGLIGDTDGDRACLWEVTAPGSADNVTTNVLAGGRIATAVNTSGEIVGDSMAFDSDSRLWFHAGLYWHDRASQPLPLPPLPGDNETFASGMNKAGIIVGSSTFRHAAYDSNGNVQQTFTVDTIVAWRVIVASRPSIKGPFVLDTSEGLARDINECDANGVAQAVGQNTGGPVMWNVCYNPDDSVSRISGPTSLVPQNRRGWGEASGVNNHGDACGQMVGAIAFRTLTVGMFQELSTPRGAYSAACDINDVQQTVGQVIDDRKGEYGTLWQADGSCVDLNTFLDLSSPWRRIWVGRAITSGGIIAATRGHGPRPGRTALSLYRGPRRTYTT